MIKFTNKIVVTHKINRFVNKNGYLLLKKKEKRYRKTAMVYINLNVL